MRNYTQRLGIMNFKYNGIDDNGTVNLTGEVYYSHKQGQDDTSLNRVIINSPIIKTMSGTNIRRYVENYIRDEFFLAAEKYIPNVRNAIANVKVDKIKLWANAPEAENGICKKPITFYFKEEKTNHDPFVTDEDTLKIFDSLNDMFEFCIENPILEKYYITVDTVNSGKDYYVKLLKHLCKIHSIKEKKHTSLFKCINDYIQNPVLKEYRINKDIMNINLLEYFKTGKFSDAVEAKMGLSNQFILTTASIDKLNEIKESLIIELGEARRNDSSELELLISDFEFFADFIPDKINSKYSLTVYTYGICEGTYDFINEE